MKLFESFADELTTIPDCPRSEAALKSIARHLESICQNEEEARWLVNEAQMTWESWKGPKGLAEMLYNKLNPEMPHSNLYKPPADWTSPECNLCGDWGHRDDPVTKLRIWCQCEMGKWQESRHPGLVEALNGNKTRSRAFSAPITRKEIKSTPEWLKELEGKYDAS